MSVFRILDYPIWTDLGPTNFTRYDHQIYQIRKREESFSLYKESKLLEWDIPVSQFDYVTTHLPEFLMERLL